MAKKIRLACIVPIPEDPTSFYRGVGPLAILQGQSQKLDIQFLFPQPINWTSFELCDAVFMQRPCVPEHWMMMVLAKEMGKPVWVDFDDDNLAVPKDNPSYPHYAPVHIKDSIVKLARYADVLTVSTEFLKTKYGIYNKNTFVIPNALPDRLVHIQRNIPAGPRHKVALWRGTATHQRNLRVIQNEIIELAKAHQDWKFAFFGCEPLDITENIKNYGCIPQHPVSEFFKKIVEVHPTLTYYSLANNDHAQSRSHVSWLEATFAGSVMIAPDIAEFRRPGVLNFATPAEYKEKMHAVMNGEVDVDKHVEESWKAIQENYLLSKVNVLREQLLDQMKP